MEATTEPTSLKKSKHPTAELIAPRALKRIGILIAELRKLRSWSRADLAGQAGLRLSTIRRLELGDSGVAVHSWVCCLAALDVLHELVGILDTDRDSLGRAQRQDLLAKPDASVVACGGKSDRQLIPPMAQLIIPAAWPRNAPSVPLEVMLGKKQEPVGELRIRISGSAKVSSFQYNENWLEDGNYVEVSPDLPKTSVLQWRKTPRAGEDYVFSTLADTLPSGFALRVIERACERGLLDRRGSRSLSPLEELCAHVDTCRMGALRIRVASGASQAHVPKSRLLPNRDQLSAVGAAVEAFEQGSEDEAQLMWLLMSATALGGSHAHCSWNRADGSLAVAKFPSVHDGFPSIKAEMLGMQLAKAAGIQIADVALEEINLVPVLMSSRVDRDAKGGRKHYVFARRFLLAQDGDEVGYPDLLKVMKTRCENFEADTVQLWLRLMFGLLINDPCCDLRKIGFIYAGKQRWRLAPAVGIQPRLPVLAEERRSRMQALMTDHEAFGMTQEAALKNLRNLLEAIQGWRKLAAGSKVGLSTKEIGLLESAMDTSQIDDLDIMAATGRHP